MEIVANKHKIFFIEHLNKIYCAKTHFFAHLPGIVVQAHFSDLRQAIKERSETLERQIDRIEQIYRMLKVTIFLNDCDDAVMLLENSYQAIFGQVKAHDLCDLAILFYMENVENIELASSRVLKIVVEKLDQPGIIQLLRENFEEALEDRALLLHLTRIL
jgi:ferritin-like metal-binding protein YciE